MARVSVLMPAFAQAAFLPRAAGSLLAQTERDWELVVVDDGSPDDVAAALGGLRGDPRVRLERHARNEGLGRALNPALAATRAPVVAYLPCDDVWRTDHLATLLAALDAEPGAVSAVASLDGPSDPVLQLVQVAHRRTPERWTERAELESDDLGLLFWNRLRTHGTVTATTRPTCSWTAHPGQRHRAIRESCDGGLNAFRRRYGVRDPLRFHSTESGAVDEVAAFRAERERPDTPRAPDGLRILLAGELAYNPDRVLALEERGHALSGTWIRDPLGFNTVGPLPFGHVEETGAGDPREVLRRTRPDVVYALLNWRAIPLAHALLGRGVPVVWHFKEAPQRAVARGDWPLLADLHARADGVVYSTALERDWFEAALPGRRDPATVLVLDGDLPRASRQAGPLAARRSAADGEPHVALLGRVAGVDPAFAGALAGAGVHLHLHGVPRTPAGRRWIADVRAAAGSRVHEEAPVAPAAWVAALSGYDGGLLHRFASRNGGDVRLATWNDLNQPARLPTLLAAGLPLLQAASPGAAVHAQDLVRETGAGLLYGGAESLAAQLAEEVRTGAARARALAVRPAFAFDTHADRLLAFFRGIGSMANG